jgi:hypothetical protein
MALKTFFDNNLRPGLCWNPSSCIPFTEPPSAEAKLVYQDATSCSASHAMSDVWLMPDQSYVVTTDTGCPQFTGDYPDSQVITTPCATLREVLVELIRFCFHDPNTCGDMMLEVLGKINAERVSELELPEMADRVSKWLSREVSAKKAKSPTPTEVAQNVAATSPKKAGPKKRKSNETECSRCFEPTSRRELHACFACGGQVCGRPGCSDRCTVCEAFLCNFMPCSAKCRKCGKWLCVNECAECDCRAGYVRCENPCAKTHVCE